MTTRDHAVRLIEEHLDKKAPVQIIKGDFKINNMSLLEIKKLGICVMETGEICHFDDFDEETLIRILGYFALMEDRK
jgi:Ni2+-binding GTPase involved in maturation of urease and hydrogenase